MSRFGTGDSPLRNTLVPLGHIDQAAAALKPSQRANADFVAHLIATKAQVPQSRARRRAEPEHAVAAYGAVGHWPTPAGRTLSRSL
jgi:hypothetical protein